MQILIADDDKTMLKMWREWFEGNGHDVTPAADGMEAVEKAKQIKPAVCVLDVQMPHMDGIEALQKIKAALPDTEVIMATAHADVKNAVKAMKEGAYDYLMKPICFEDAEATIERAIERRHILTENRYLRHELGEETAYREIVGDSPPMLELRKKIEQAAKSSANVLIRGESGTGKELAARQIHYQGDRAKGRFIAVNVAALSETIFESEMFGHEKNAFTGAAELKKGRFELADKGTLLLDEISEIPSHQQTKLLRIIQEGRFERVGGTSPINTDVRIISTTNRDLEELVEEGSFRKDLYYRINVFQITVPPLRDRKEDIALLTDQYLKFYARIEGKPITSISPEAMERLMDFNWPGNVRELMHCIESAVILEEGKALSLESVMAAKLPEPAASQTTLRDGERNHIQNILNGANGDRKKAASMLGVSKTTLYRKIKEHNL